MRYLYIKAVRTIKKLYINEFQRLAYKSIFSNMQLPFVLRQFSFFLSNGGNCSSFTYHRLRGYQYGRSRFVFKYYKLSRMQLKRFSNESKLVGIKRSK
jgi:hypothetical protein